MDNEEIKKEPEKEFEEEIDGEEVDKKIDEANDKGVYVLKNPIEFEGKTISEINIEKIRKLRYRDVKNARLYLKKVGLDIEPGASIYDSPELCLTILWQKTGIPVELIDELSVWDAAVLHNMVRLFFRIWG